jgi:FtsZ-binding cell division protein ZapB
MNNIDSIQMARYMHSPQRTITCLLKEIEDLKAENERLTREKDAAVSDLNALRKKCGCLCFACKHDENYNREICSGCEYNNANNWEWRGMEGGAK